MARSYGDESPFRLARREPLLTRSVPVTQDVRDYRVSTARRDVLAGVTVAALAVPSAMAYAEVAGLSPVNGLYALLLPMIAYVLLGSSRQLVVGPEGSIATLVAASILPLASAGSNEAAQLAAMLALLVGGAFALARLARLEWIGDYFSRPVLIGYIHGVAIVLVISQIGKLLGISVSARNPIDEVLELARHLGETSGVTVVVSVVTLVSLALCRIFVPRLPATLVVVVLSLPVSRLLDLAGHGVAVVGAVPAGLPSIGVPHATLTMVVKLLPAAGAIFLVCFADEILTARSYAGRHGQHVRARQELIAMGAADLAAGLSQGFPIGASGSRTAVNDSMGVRTQVSGAVAVAVVTVILLFATAPIQYLPKPVLASVIVFAAIGIVDLDAWRQLRAVDPVELAIAAVTMCGVVLVGVLQAIVTAVGLSVVDAVRRSARPSDAVLGWVERLGRYGDVSLHPSARTTPGILVYRLDDRLFFANAGYFKARVREALRGAPDEVRWLVFDAEAVAHADATGLEALEQLVDELERNGVRLAIARLRTRLYERFEPLDLVDRIGSENFYPSIRAAVDGCAARTAAV